MGSNDQSLATTLLTFLALYFTTLFSLDTWAAARGSPYRPASNETFYRPAPRAPVDDSYQAGMHGWGNAGPPRGGDARGGRDVGRVPQARDSRPPVGMGVSARCGACMT